MSKRFVLNLMLAASAIISLGQSSDLSSSKSVDVIVDTMDLKTEYNPIDLEWVLAEPFESDSQKVRAFFYWITKNIAYDYNAYLNNTSLVYDPNKDADVDAYYYRRICRTLMTKKGVCLDYALLFQFLCKSAKIPCEIVEGYGLDTKPNGLLKFFWNASSSNHAWNAVMINNQWYLLDATFASGYIDLSKAQFVKCRSDFYYLTPPELFILDHYPVMSKWQLLKNPLDVDAFIENAKYNREIKSDSVRDQTSKKQ